MYMIKKKIAHCYALQVVGCTSLISARVDAYSSVSRCSKASAFEKEAAAIAGSPNCSCDRARVNSAGNHAASERSTARCALTIASNDRPGRSNRIWACVMGGRGSVGESEDASENAVSAALMLPCAKNAWPRVMAATKASEAMIQRSEAAGSVGGCVSTLSSDSSSLGPKMEGATGAFFGWDLMEKLIISVGGYDAN